MPGILKPIICIAIYIVISWDVIKEAFEGIREGEIFGEELLMVIASVGAICIGNYYEAIAVMLLFRVGEWLEDKAEDKTRDSIAELMDIRPDSATLPDGNVVNPSEVHVGDEIMVKPGDKIPLDGTVISGSSMIDTSALTGESVPRHAAEGDEVISGCVNSTGKLIIRVTKEYSESTASKILELVESAEDHKSKSENFITRFSKIYTPVVCGLALLLAVVPPLITGQEFKIWIYRALTFLVVSCPCALVISVPLSFFAGLGSASREGILIKGSNYLEALGHAKTVAMDKTGTLTKGVFRVQKIEPAAENDGADEIAVLSAAVMAESFSSHPIAKSIIEEGTKKGIQNNPDVISDVTEISGQGVRVAADGKEILAGNAKLMKNNQIAFDEYTGCETTVYVAEDGKYIGRIIIADEIKDDAPTAVCRLKECKIDRLVILTGDKDEIAKSVAEKVGINEVYGGLLPEDKVDRVEKLIDTKEPGSTVVFVGDGVNDAPVLARADVGVSMGALGSDAAIEAADVVIMDDKPSRLPLAIKLARRTTLIAKQNIAFALAVKVLVLIAGALGRTTMWAAVFADVGVALLCILNSMRNMKRIDADSWTAYGDL